LGALCLFCSSPGGGFVVFIICLLVRCARRISSRPRAGPYFGHVPLSACARRHDAAPCWCKVRHTRLLHLQGPRVHGERSKVIFLRRVTFSKRKAREPRVSGSGLRSRFAETVSEARQGSCHAIWGAHTVSLPTRSLPKAEKVANSASVSPVRCLRFLNGEPRRRSALGPRRHPR